MSYFPEMRPSASDADPRWQRELDQITGTGPQKTRTVPVRMLAPLLMAAQQSNSTWLTDFADDVVVIDADLHDVLLAYQRISIEAAEQSAQRMPDRKAA